MRRLLVGLFIVCFTPAALAQSRAGDDQRDERDDLKGLKARVERLEGLLTTADIAGTYTLHLLQTELGPNWVQHATEQATVQINANSTYSVSGTEKGFRLDLQPKPARAPINKADTSSGTWRFAPGTLSLKEDGSSEEFALTAAGSRLFIGTGTTASDGTTTLVILVRRR
jgi:hypothetical protein